MFDELKSKANQALQAGNHSEALHCYEQILKLAKQQGVVGGELVYLNGGACLRTLKRQEEAVKWLQEGLKHYPFSSGVHKNLANSLVDLKESRWRSLFHYLMASQLGPSEQGLTLSVIASLHELGFPLVAYHMLHEWWQQALTRPEDLPSDDMIRGLLELGLTLFEDEELEPVASWCLERLQKTHPARSCPEHLALAGICFRRGDIAEGMKHYRHVEAEVAAGRFEDGQLFINASWNQACLLLKQGEMALGWRLYEFGLRAPAREPQRWQRALMKVFKASEVPVWRGEELAEGSRLLLLQEQAIGDTMMFLQLMPALMRQPIHITLLLPSRLVDIYTRTFPKIRIVSTQNAENELKASDFDWQCPVGSLPRHLLKSWIDLGAPNLRLKCQASLKTKLRREYRRGLAKDKPVIGISWSGGARRERIRVKSLRVDEFGELMQSIDARFVSLQYGEFSKQIAKWQAQGIDIQSNPEINPLRDMDSWLAQVAACDLVISVANTTIHGAALTGIPTLCLLSRGSDWRWVDQIDGSYWYDCVDVARQERNGSWKPALASAPEWVRHRMDDPKGAAMQASARSRSEKLSFREWL